MKKLLALSLAIILVISLAACGQASLTTTSNESTSATVKKDVTINFMADTSLPWEKLNPLIEEFTKETGIKVNSLVLEEGNLWTKTGLEVSAPSTDINVIMGHTKDTSAFTSAGYLEPLDDYLKNIPTYNEADYSKAYLDAFRDSDGKLYGLPMYNVGVVLAYRADIFAKYGITLPETWDDLINICETLKGKETGMSPFAMRAQRPDFAFSILYRGFGGDYLDGNGKSIMNVDIAEKSIDYFVNLLNNYAPNGVANYSFTEVQTDFMQGKIAMTIETQDTCVRLEDPNESPLTAGKIGYWVIPNGVRRVAPGFSWGLIIPKNTQKKEEAAQFIGWLMSPAIASQIGLTFPKQAWEKEYSVPAYKEYSQSISLLECMERTAEVTNLDYCPRDSKFAELKTAIINSVQSCLTGSMSAKDAAQQIIETSKQIYP